MPAKNEVSISKFKAVLHYIIHKCGAYENVGKTVLYKMLYFSDFDFFELTEKSITGEIYCKLPKGPAPVDFDKTVTELVKENKIKEIKVPYLGKVQTKFLCIEQPSSLPLSADEVKHIDKTINKLCSMNATQISAYSHGDMPWKAAKNNGILDYEMVFYRDDLYSVREYGDDTRTNRPLPERSAKPI